MNVRGAPLIADVAALGLAVDLLKHKGSFASATQAVEFVKKSADHLRTSRPTAVNLFIAMDEIVAAAEQEVGFMTCSAARRSDWNDDDDDDDDDDGGGVGGGASDDGSGTVLEEEGENDV